MQKLSSFIKDSFKIINPGVKYHHNWHIDLIAEALTEVSKSNIKRLIINIPPRSLKSVCISVAWPAWLLANDPTRRIMCASYSQILSNKHSTDTRNLINSKWYKENFPEVNITYDQNEKAKFVTTKRGFRFATSIGGTATGEGGNFLILDDPHNPTQAASPIQRQKAIEWFEQTFTTRLDDKKKGAIVIVMQRFHTDDLCGYLLKKNPGLWKIVKLPAIAEFDETLTIGKKKYFRAIGDILHPKREDKDNLAQMKLELGDYGFSAQYQQEPIAAIGSLIKESWLKYYDELPQLEQIIISWDTAIKAASHNDYSVATIWGIGDCGYYLIDVLRGKYEYPSLKAEAISLAEKYSPNAILIEDKASGQSLIQDLKLSTTLPVIAIKIIQDKITRFARVSAYFDAGKVFLPKHALWLGEYKRELFGFPKDRWDDQVDSTSQFLNWIISRQKIANIRIREL